MSADDFQDYSPPARVELNAAGKAWLANLLEQRAERQRAKEQYQREYDRYRRACKLRDRLLTN